MLAHRTMAIPCKPRIDALTMVPMETRQDTQFVSSLELFKANHALALLV
jgi:hypothetical protein